MVGVGGGAIQRRKRRLLQMVAQSTTGVTWGVEERWALEQENWGPACEDGPALRDTPSAQFPPVEWGSLANSQLPG